MDACLPVAAPVLLNAAANLLDQPTPAFAMSLLKEITLGIDFGTSNSAMAVRHGAGPARMLCLEGNAHTLPTAVFFNSENHGTHFGRDAVDQYLLGTEGRLMRSLKSLLGSALLQDKTAVHNNLVSYQDIIGLFLLSGKVRAALDAGQFAQFRAQFKADRARGV